jgi:hypothetical protein
MLLLSITSFLYVLWTIKDPIIIFLEMKYPEHTTARYKRAIGTVVHLDKSSTTNHSIRENRTYTTSSTVARIHFKDDKDHLFQISWKPIFINIKQHSQIPVLYTANEFNEHSADRSKEIAKELNSTYVSATGVYGIPFKLTLWLERPIIFTLISLLLLVLRFGVKLLKNSMIGF